MGILSETTRLNLPAPCLALRLVSTALGLSLGIGLSVLSLHAHPPAAPTVSHSAITAAHRLAAVVRKRPLPRKSVAWHQLGLASWYGEQFQGRQTANGEIFDMNGLTCAHRTLPLGTWIKVTNMHTRKWIVVRVNDRGPVPQTRIADLSSEAAHMLGMRSRGVTRVRLDLIDPKRAVKIARLEELQAASELAAMQLPEIGN